MPLTPPRLWSHCVYFWVLTEARGNERAVRDCHAIMGRIIDFHSYLYDYSRNYVAAGTAPKVSYH
ncbi:hypothetical protein A9Z42_0021530 [Trichoderma parareesei]|uniref:Uncharacterized protein n=1 Tax=Trichoderma parareesei TaxID=858221 RepID=A0A2H2ZEN9_TRIPA|nr:hypothetical protein A9Z42_0021530 [Trichoderma parareesei]